MVHGLETIEKLNNQQASADRRDLAELFGVFFMSEHMDIEGIEDQSIHIFSTLDDAEKFVVDGLVAANILKPLDGGGWTFVGDDFGDVFTTKAEAIFEAQDSFYGMEFFHIYKTTDHR